MIASDILRLYAVYWVVLFKGIRFILRDIRRAVR